MSAHRQREANRERALSEARAGYERMVADARAKAAAENAALEARRAAFAAGDPEAVEWFVSRVLDGSQYPGSFPHQYQIAYRPENRDVVVEFELPPQTVVPAVRGYRYIKARDAIDLLPRPGTEVKQRHARTTAWFGRASEHTANRNRITLANDAERKQLIKEHLKMEVLPGAAGRHRRLRAPTTPRPVGAAPPVQDQAHSHDHHGIAGSSFSELSFCSFAGKLVA